MTALHLAVLLFGAAGLFGKLVPLPAVTLVLGRVIFASLSLGLLLGFRGTPLLPDSRREALRLFVPGALLTLHWVAFFRAIQLSTVAVGLLTFATFPIFTAFLEPRLGGDDFRWRDAAAALVTFAGVALVVPRFDLAAAATRGALWGVGSGLSFAFLSIVNRRLVQRRSSLVVAFHQDLVAAVLLVPTLVWIHPSPSPRDLVLLVLLGTVFTALAHSLFIRGLRTVEARTASIVTTLEPLYGILLAALLLGEVPGPRILAGGGLILAATAWVTLRTPPTPVSPG